MCYQYRLLDGRWVNPEGTGPIVLIIGDMPTEIDMCANKVFSDNRGDLVDNVIRLISPAARVYYTNLFRSLYVDIDIITSFQKPLDCIDPEAIVKQIKPQVVIALGEMAFRAMTGRAGITKHREESFYFDDIPVVPARPPGLVLRNLKYLPQFKSDIAKALEYACSTLSKEGSI